MKLEIKCINTTEFTQFKSVLELLRNSFAFMEDRINPPSSLRLLNEQSLKEKAQQETLFVLNVDDQLAGCVFARNEIDFLYLGKLAVSADYRGQGLARRLIEKVEQHARELGVENVEIETRVELIENQSLFEYLGYRKVAENAHAGFTRATSFRYRKSVN